MRGARDDSSVPRWDQLARAERLVVIGGAATLVGGVAGILIGEYHFSGIAAWILVLPALSIGFTFARAMNPLGRWLAEETVVGVAAVSTLALALANGLELLKADRSQLAFGGALDVAVVIAVIIGGALTTIGGLRLEPPTIERMTLEMPTLARLDRPRVVLVLGGLLILLGWALMLWAGTFVLDFGAATAIVLAVTGVAWGIRGPMSVAAWVAVAAALAAYIASVLFATASDIASTPSLRTSQDLGSFGVFAIGVIGMLLAVLVAVVERRTQAG
jgi:hypothetical protein